MTEQEKFEVQNHRDILLDWIQDVISNTHDVDVTDSDYAEEVVLFLEKCGLYPPKA